MLVDYTGGNEALGKDLAMHIAATQADGVSSREQVPADVIAKERGDRRRARRRIAASLPTSSKRW